MKKLIFSISIVLLAHFAKAQTHSTLIMILEVVEKVQNDKKLTGIFNYNGYKIDIHESHEFKSVIGK
jgi:hypothetical protein